ncbi:prealbumin-like fold domain-containing protein [Microbulbifer sp.]|uniref:prealbumin-like fold domain-containing protein n=1 Tax=Microbulbifer sp. TaxID=1908541 RepID=UPI003F39AD34
MRTYFGLWGICLLLALAPEARAQITPTAALKDQTCLGERISNPNCTAKEFTVSPSFSAEPGTPPFCEAGAEFEFVVDVRLFDSNADRYNIGLFVGQQGNDPQVTSSGNFCSVATFPTTSPSGNWFDADGNACGDFFSGADDTVRVTEIKVVCQGDSATSALQVPYVLTYQQNTGGLCSSPEDVEPGGKSKCQADSALVDGVVSVSAGAYIDVTKETQPGGEGQVFDYTASGPAGSQVIVRLADGVTYTSDLNSAGNQASFTLSDGQTARVYINALPAAQTLQITEDLETGWDSTALINCSAQRGSPAITTDEANRSISADLDENNSAAACTITNRKLPRVTVTKVTSGDSGSFTFTGNNGWTSQTITTPDAGTPESGAAQFLAAFAVPTELVEVPESGWRLAGIDCTGLGSGGSATADLVNHKVTLDAAAVSEPGGEIGCTFSNVRQRTLTVTKQLTPLTPWPGGDSGLFVMNANGTTGPEGGDGASANALVDVGSSVSFSESAGSGSSLDNYDASYSCNTSPATAGDGTAGSLTMPNADVDCTFSNTRRSATLTLRKTWVDASSGDTVTVASSGFSNDATTGEVVSSGDNTAAGAPVTVYAGESATIAETFSVGDPADYSLAIDCSGSSGLAGSTLTVAPADTDIVCTATNTRSLPALTLLKWVAPVWDPVNGADDPKAIPQSISSYALRLSNAGDGSVDADSLVLRDALPADVDLYVGDLAGAGSGPVVFTEGDPASGLSWEYTSLDSGTDGLDFSLDGINWDYVPVPDADGFDAAVRHIRLRPGGGMNPASGGLSAWAEFGFRVRVR